MGIWRKTVRSTIDHREVRAQNASSVFGGHLSTARRAQAAHATRREHAARKSRWTW